QSKDTASWAASPLWRVVDGPYRLSSSYRPLLNGTLVANPRYGGPSNHQITKLIQASYPSAAAAFQALQAGKVDVAAVPSQSPAPRSRYAPDNAADAYPYSVSAAGALLSTHGWIATPDGTGYCVNQGTGPGDCGAGIPAGTKLAFNLVYPSGSVLASQEVHAL